MQERLLNLAGLKVHALGPEGPGPAVLLCHGFGAPGNDLVPLAEALDLPQVRWFFPEAPLDLREHGIPGRAWWPIDMMRLQMMVMTNRAREMLEETPPGLPQARTALEGVLAALERDHGVARDRLLIGGFSQGAMLATEVALHAQKPFAGLVILSGTLISAPRWAEAMKASGASLKVLQSHGRSDPILPFAAAEGLHGQLAKTGAQVEWVAHDGGHEIPLRTLVRLQAFARDRLRL